MNHQRSRLFSTLLLPLLLLLAACGSRQEPTALPGCEGAPRPVVFVHGFLGAGDSFANAVLRFASNGYCPAYLRVFDWNTLSFDMPANATSLADFVDQVLKEIGAQQVDLVGHSMGGRLSHDYLQEHADQVAHYVHAASFCGLDFPDGLPVLVLSSDEDTVVGSCIIEGAENQDLDGADHLQVVTVPDAFVAMYRFFNAGQSPGTTQVVTEEVVTLAGKVLAFGTNQPATGALVEVFPLDAATGERLAPTPAARFTVAGDGAWGPFQADPSTYYEFAISEKDQRPFHYYRQPFPRSSSLVYLRILPESNPLLNLILGQVRYDDCCSSIVLFSANQALYHGRDTATLDGLELSTPEMAPPPPDPTSTIAIFIFDADEDGQTDGGPVPMGLSGLSFLPGHDDSGEGQAPSQFPFLRMYDAFLDASTRRGLTLTMNGATLHVPTWKGASEGPSIVVFDYGEDGL